jgi:hypothetical protein
MINKVLVIVSLSLIAFKVQAKEERYSRIPIELNEIENETVSAKIITGEEQSELDGVLLEGEKRVLEQEGNIKKIKILWGKLKLDEHEAELEEFFVSDVTVEGSLEEGDQFSARVDSQELLNVFHRLKSNSLSTFTTSEEIDEEIAEEEEVATQLGTFASSTGGSSGVLSDDTSDYDSMDVSPNYEVEVVEVEYDTTDGCDYRIDIDEMTVTVQKRTIKGDEEISPCADTEVSYSLNKDYENCSKYVDVNAEKVFPKYRITYDNIDGDGVIQVVGCQLDKEKFTKLVRDYKACGIKHDTAKEKSFGRYRLVYQEMVSGKQIIYQDCIEDEDITYSHFVDNESCETKVEGGEVTFYERRGIEVEGKKEYISDCLPIENASKLYEEICSNKKYTHDFKGGQTFLNKNHFYFKAGDRVDVSSCAKSDVALEHKLDTEPCEIEHSFEDNTSQLYAKTYIEDSSLSGGKVFLTECEPTGNEISHVTTKSKWIKVSQEYKRLDSISDAEYPISYKPFGGIFGYSYFSTSYKPYDRYKIDLTDALRKYYNSGNLYHSNGGGKYKDWDRYTSTSRCRDLENSSDWHDYISYRTASAKDLNRSTDQHINSDFWSFNDQDINGKYSDAKPTADASLVTRKCPTVYLPHTYSAYFTRLDKSRRVRGSTDHAKDMYRKENYLIEYKATIKNVGCEVTTLARKPIYRSIDGVEYVDDNTTLETMYVCGTGAKLEGLEI